jgi:hypothetical protein
MKQANVVRIWASRIRKGDSTCILRTFDIFHVCDTSSITSDLPFWVVDMQGSAIKVFVEPVDIMDRCMRRLENLVPRKKVAVEGSCVIKKGGMDRVHRASSSTDVPVVCRRWW